MGLQIMDVTKKYADKQVLTGIRLNVDKGDFLALLGPSGCGKTTLLNAIAGLTGIHSGRIVIDGVTVSGQGREVPTEKRRIGMVFQDFALWPHMNVFENVAFGLKQQGVRGQELKRRVVETLRIFHMEAYLPRYPHELSGGQKQRIAMARAIAPQPNLILMDEPLSSLDAGLRDEMRVELVRIFKSLQMTVVYVTHDQLEAMSMADRIAIMKDGRIEQIGTPEALYNEPVSAYVAKFMGAANLLPNREGDGSRFIRPEDVEMHRKSPGGIVYTTQHWICGKILVRAYQGQRYRYYVEADGIDRPMEVLTQEKVSVGELVVLHIPDDKCKEIRENAEFASFLGGF